MKRKKNKVQILIVILAILISAAPVYGQKKKKTVKPALDTTTVFHDMFRGPLPHGEDTVYTLLILDHKLYHDEGTFTLDESYKKQGGKIPSFKTAGKWTLLRGTPEDEDAQVVEIDGAELATYFLRRNDSTLQKIDATMHEILPAANYILRKTGGKQPGAKDVLTQNEITLMRLAGTYKGKLTCADCDGILSTLSLRYKLHAKTGDYTLADKYVGTKHGDITDGRKGKWNFASKLIEADHKSTVIVLDPDKPGHEVYYLVKKDGIIQLDDNMKRIESNADQTLKRQ